jgi:hypothetical protein
MDQQPSERGIRVGSVIACWSGSCPDPKLQEQLWHLISPIAELSHGLFSEAPAGFDHDEVLEGRILVDHRIFSEPPTTLPPAAGEADEEAPSFELRLSGSTEAPRLRLATAYELPRVKVRGPAFRLYDARGFYPDENEVSLLFASSDEYRELNGQLVALHNRSDCQRSENETIQQADWYLTRPSIHLRYYCEEWMDLLMGTIKYFFIPDLVFWRYRPNPNYAELVQVFEEMDHDSLVERAFSVLLDRFRTLVDDWSVSAASIREFWDTANATLNLKSGS